MTFTYYHIASAFCAGAGSGLIVAAQYYGGRLLKKDSAHSQLMEATLSLADENSDLREVIRSLEATLSRYHLTMGKPPEIDPATTQMCGGCGAFLTQEEIDACPGETCSRFAEATLPLFASECDHTTFEIPAAPERKINIGYTGHLHTSQKPLR